MRFKIELLASSGTYQPTQWSGVHVPMCGALINCCNMELRVCYASMENVVMWLHTASGSLLQRLKQYMSYDEDVQAPIFFLPEELLASLEGPYPLGFNARRETPAQYKDQLRKHAKIMTEHPYCFKRAAEYLMKFVSDDIDTTPPFDISFCKLNGSPTQHVEVVRSIDDEHEGVMSLEPTATFLKLGRVPKKTGRGRAAVAKPMATDTEEASGDSKRIYDEAAKLVLATPSLTWQDAIALAEKVDGQVKEHIGKEEDDLSEIDPKEWWEPEET